MLGKPFSFISFAGTWAPAAPDGLGGGGGGAGSEEGRKGAAASGAAASNPLEVLEVGRQRHENVQGPGETVSSPSLPALCLSGGRRAAQCVRIRSQNDMSNMPNMPKMPPQKNAM